MLDVYRDQRARCPKCGEPEVGYDVMWDCYRCKNGHGWDGPINDKSQPPPSPNANGRV